jgi:hypothetical protein
MNPSLSVVFGFAVRDSVVDNKKQKAPAIAGAFLLARSAGFEPTTF